MKIKTNPGKSDKPTLLDNLASMMRVIKERCPTSSNLSKEGFREWPHLQLLCVRHDFSDHPDLLRQLKLIDFAIRKPDGKPLNVKITYDSDYPSTSSVKKLSSWIEENVPELSYHDGTRASREKLVKQLARKASQFHVGNCGELTAICYRACKRIVCHEEPLLTAEYLNLDDHALLVVNRRPDSKLSNYRTWGEDCIIVDAWSSECYYLQPAIDEKAFYCSYLDIELSSSFEVFLRYKADPPLSDLAKFSLLANNYENSETIACSPTKKLKTYHF